MKICSEVNLRTLFDFIQTVFSLKALNDTFGQKAVFNYKFC